MPCRPVPACASDASSRPTSASSTGWKRKPGTIINGSFDVGSNIWCSNVWNCVARRIVNGTPDSMISRSVASFCL